MIRDPITGDYINHPVQRALRHEGCLKDCGPLHEVWLETKCKICNKVLKKRSGSSLIICIIEEPREGLFCSDCYKNKEKLNEWQSMNQKI